MATRTYNRSERLRRSIKAFAIGIAVSLFPLVSFDIYLTTGAIEALLVAILLAGVAIGAFAYGIYMSTRPALQAAWQTLV